MAALVLVLVVSQLWQGGSWETCIVGVQASGEQRSWSQGLQPCPSVSQRVGCGECTACQVKEDCGACSTCCLQLPGDVASGLFFKCEQKRCLRIVERVSPVPKGEPRASVPGLHNPDSTRHTSGLPTEPRVWHVSGLSDPRGLWPLPHLPSLSPPWSQAPVEVFAAALFLGESGWRDW